MLKAPRSAYLEYLNWLATAEPEPRVIASRQVARHIIAEMEIVGAEKIVAPLSDDEWLESCSQIATNLAQSGLDERGRWHAPDPVAYRNKMRRAGRFCLAAFSSSCWA